VLPKRELFHRFESYGEEDEPFEMAYYLWVITGSDGERFVVDTGFDPMVAERRGRICDVSPVDALRIIGLDPGSIETVILSHLHFDHIGNVSAFPRARFVVGRRELAFWAGPLALRAQFAAHIESSEVERVRELSDNGRVVLVDDRLALADGIELITVGGHSPGQVLIRVSDSEGSVVLASDSVHFYEEIALDRPFSIFVNLDQVYEAYDVVSAFRARGAALVPGHDPGVATRFAELHAERGMVAVDVRARAQRPS